MNDVLKVLLKQPYWILTLVLGAALVIFPCITIDKDYHWATHPPNTLLPVVVGIILLLVSLVTFGLMLRAKQIDEDKTGAGLDMARVKENAGALWTNVSGCEIRIINGRIEEHDSPGVAIALPCNEYFDDRCVGDTRSSLGAYVNRIFEGQAEAFVSLMKEECKKRLGPGIERQKTEDERSESYGAGRCVLLLRPLNRSVPVAVVSTTTQRAGQGLASRISYLFDGMRELAARLADARISEVAMPILGAGHGGIDPPLALVGLLLAIAETARYGQGGQRLKRVTIIVFKQNADAVAEVDPLVVRRTLALIGE